MNEIELSAGTLQYFDSGGEGPTVVLPHRLMMDATLWNAVIADLVTDHRCIAPTLPLGAHRRPMSSAADLSLPGIAAIVTEFLDRLELQVVVLVGNDTGGALAQLVMREDTKRVGRVVLASCEAFDNLSPGLPGKRSPSQVKCRRSCSGCSFSSCDYAPSDAYPLPSER